MKKRVDRPANDKVYTENGASDPRLDQETVMKSDFGTHPQANTAVTVHHGVSYPAH
jgi:hypothetical protein